MTDWRNNPPWSAEEDDKLRAAKLLGMTYSQAAIYLPGRTVHAMEIRWRGLRDRASFVVPVEKRNYWCIQCESRVRAPCRSPRCRLEVMAVVELSE